jgi:ATP-dependent DNA helicase PIF1
MIGIAACNIGGTTVNYFAGIGLGIGSAEHLVEKMEKRKKIKHNREALKRWHNTDVLIIDEGRKNCYSLVCICILTWYLVSMTDGDLLDKLSEIGRIIRCSPEPFGGIQVDDKTYYDTPNYLRGIYRLS